MDSSNILIQAKKCVAGLLYDISVKLHEMKKSTKVAKIKSKRKNDLIFYCVMLVFPIAQFCLMWIGTNSNSILLAFKKYDANLNYTFSLDNFQRVFTEITSSSVIHRSLQNSFLFYFISSVLTIPVSLIISFYFYKKFRFSRALKVIFFLPSIVAGVVTVTCFYYIVDRGYPFIMHQLFGIDTMGLLVNNQTQMGVIIFFSVFYSLTSGFLFYSSAMSGIDNSISEAAQIDGANSARELIHISIPMIYPTLSVCFIAGTASIFISDFAMYAFFKTASGTTLTTMGFYFINGITSWGEREYPYFAAFGLVLTFFACIITFSVRAIVGRLDPFRDKKTKEKIK